jgi:hypothetical protein
MAVPKTIWQMPGFNKKLKQLLENNHLQITNLVTGVLRKRMEIFSFIFGWPLKFWSYLEIRIL